MSNDVPEKMDLTSMDVAEEKQENMIAAVPTRHPSKG